MLRGSQFPLLEKAANLLLGNRDVGPDFPSGEDREDVVFFLIAEFVEQFGICVHSLVTRLQEQDFPVDQGLQVVFPRLLPFLLRPQSRQEVEHKPAQLFRGNLALSNHCYDRVLGLLSAADCTAERQQEEGKSERQ